jgi:quinolinate synthase
MILWEGSCMVHEVFSVGDLLRMKRRLPEARTIAHPECPANIREQSDFIGGTEAMIRHVAGFDQPVDFLVATEANMLWQLQNTVPRHRYHPVPGITCACNKCPHMARNTLEKMRDCLLNGKPEIEWQPDFEVAAKVLRRSLLED